jgi:hypothetical protein
MINELEIPRVPDPPISIVTERSSISNQAGKVVFDNTTTKLLNELLKSCFACIPTCIGNAIPFFVGDG